MEETSEIEFLRQQRSRLIERLESRRKKSSELLGRIEGSLPDTPGGAFQKDLRTPSPAIDAGAADSSRWQDIPLSSASNSQPQDAQDSSAFPPLGPVSNATADPARATAHSSAVDHRTALYRVRWLVASCLVSQDVILPMDSTGIARRIRKNPSLTPSDTSALAELSPGVSSDGSYVHAVERAVSDMAAGSSALLEAEEFVVAGVSRLMVLTVDRRRMAEAFPDLFNARSDTQGPSTTAPLGEHYPSDGSHWWRDQGAMLQESSPHGPLPLYGAPGGPLPFEGSLGHRPADAHFPYHQGPAGPPGHAGPGMPPRYPGPPAGGPLYPTGSFGMPGPPPAYDQFGASLQVSDRAPPDHGPPMAGAPPMYGQPGVPPGPSKGVQKRGSKSGVAQAKGNVGGGGGTGRMPDEEQDPEAFLEAILSKKSYREAQQSRRGEELLELLQKPTARETAVAARFKTKGGSMVKEYCSYLTREDCNRQLAPITICDKVHFRRIIAPHTDLQLGDCSFLDTCRHMKTCKYVHYEVDPTSDGVQDAVMMAVMMMQGHQGGRGGRGGPYWRPPAPHLRPGMPLPFGDALALRPFRPPPQEHNPFHPPSRFERPPRPEYCSQVELGECQWVNCDIRTFQLDILGQFGVIMADPPWDIHMELPYGTMADDEMRSLNVQVLQTDGLIFLWVTGRAMELGRECLELWGYKRVEELIWVKTNQLQRVIRTGRTGHWLNHSKEHCLVGLKGSPLVNRNIDTDVIVAEVRETSRKPDEMYSLIERISPRTRKIELFARMHNTHAGWISLGNQLDGVRLVDPELRERFRAKYPGVEIQPPDGDPSLRGDLGYKDAA